MPYLLDAEPKACHQRSDTALEVTSSIRISDPDGIEVDHFQYGIQGFGVPDVISPLFALGMACGLMGLMRRKCDGVKGLFKSSTAADNPGRNTR
jgi:hypothetical protein